MNVAKTAIVLIGPSHPYKGGIAQHTTRLALELEQRGKDVVVESWKSQYPQFLYNRPHLVPDGKPEIGMPNRVIQGLAWYSPLSWWLCGRRSKNAEIIVLNIPTPIHAIVYSILLWAAGKDGRRIGIFHNPVPHEVFAGAKWLMRGLLQKLDLAIVHNAEGAEQIRALSLEKTPVTVASLPSPWAQPKSSQPSPPDGMRPLRALFFGTIRAYKGLDILLRAVAEIPDYELTIAGEFWEKPDSYQRLIDELQLRNRVRIRSGYVPACDFHEVFSNADFLVLPYRAATGSYVRELGFDFGLPVIATSAGSVAEGILHGVNGLVVGAENVQELTDALRQIGDPTLLRTLRIGARALQADRAELWAKYVDKVTT